MPLVYGHHPNPHLGQETWVMTGFDDQNAAQNGYHQPHPAYPKAKWVNGQLVDEDGLAVDANPPGKGSKQWQMLLAQTLAAGERNKTH